MPQLLKSGTSVGYKSFRIGVRVACPNGTTASKTKLTKSSFIITSVEFVQSLRHRPRFRRCRKAVSVWRPHHLWSSKAIAPQIVKLRFPGMGQANASMISFSVNGMHFSVPETIPASFLAKLLEAASHGSR